MLIDQKIEKFVKREGRRPRILVSSMGKKRHNQDTRRLATIFAETGFDVDMELPGWRLKMMSTLSVF